jgi:cell division protein FtsN
MNLKTLFPVIICCALLTVSCKSAKKSANQTLSNEDVTNEIVVETNKPDESPDVTVREESVKPVDRSEKTYKYYVIIGSFRILSGARQYNTELVREGFSPSILENDNGLFRISAGGYDEENAARAQIAEIRAKYSNHGDVWLLVRK